MNPTVQLFIPPGYNHLIPRLLMLGVCLAVLPHVYICVTLVDGRYKVYPGEYSTASPHTHHGLAFAMDSAKAKPLKLLAGLQQIGDVLSTVDFTSLE